MWLFIQTDMAHDISVHMHGWMFTMTKVIKKTVATIVSSYPLFLDGTDLMTNGKYVLVSLSISCPLILKSPPIKKQFAIYRYNVKHQSSQRICLVVLEDQCPYFPLVIICLPNCICFLYIVTKYTSCLDKNMRS